MSDIDDLVNTLLTETRAGAIDWQTADARARVFIARANSGTVTIAGGKDTPTVLSTFISGGGLLNSTAEVILTVKDAAGKTVETVDWAPSRFAGSSMFATDAENLLPVLYELVKEQVTKANATIRSLTDEFRAKRGQ